MTGLKPGLFESSKKEKLNELIFIKVKLIVIIHPEIGIGCL